MYLVLYALRRRYLYLSWYWLRLRSYIGFLPVRRTLPNPTHYALAALQHAGRIGPLITQNVDGLHHAALRRVLSESELNRHILELHGSIFVSLSRSYSPRADPTSVLLDRREGERIRLIVAARRKFIVNMGTSIPVQCSKSGLEKQTRVGARSSRSSSAQARSPRQIQTAMCVDSPTSSADKVDCFSPPPPLL